MTPRPNHLDVVLLLIAIGIQPFTLPASARPEQSITKTLTIADTDVFDDTRLTRPVYPKYTSQLINLANQNAQATRPRHVGQVSELIKTFPGTSYDEWATWYHKQHPTAIDEATDRIIAMLQKLRDANNTIDRDLVRTWVRDLVLDNSYRGLRYQQSILKKLADDKQTTWRLATPAEEAQGIDGFVGATAISVKPMSYRSKPMLNEQIAARIVYYERVKSGIRVHYNLD